LLSVLFIGSCGSQSLNTPQAIETSQSSQEIKAAHALGTFLRLLNERDYTNAALLYGGEYESLQVFNPEINTADHVGLWRWACENQLLQCLEPRSAELVHQEGDSYVFQVEFTNPDGSLFVLGPCCGATETEMPPVSQFEFTVTQNADGKFVVMNTPPYVP
jgi:hypothetical protein